MLETAFKAKRPLHVQARALINDPSREFLATSLLELELTHPQYNVKYAEEAAFYQDYLANIVTEWGVVDEALVADGLETIRSTQAKSMDALHITAAIRMAADEFITMEGKEKPMHREKRIPVRHLEDI